MSHDSGNVINVDGRDRRPWALISRTKLLDAAVAEIAERGYDRARLVDIAARADLTVGAIYNWYKNKSELFNAALEHAITEQQESNLNFLNSELSKSLNGVFSSHWMLLVAALAPKQGRDTGPTDTQKMLLEALTASWREEESQHSVEPHLSALLSQYENVVQTAMNEGAIDSTLDTKLLARMLFAFPIGLSLLTLAGLPEINSANFIPIIQLLDKTLRPE